MNDEIDFVVMDIPLMIRLFELMSEEIKDDALLHQVSDKIIELSKIDDVLTMDHYEEIMSVVPDQREEEPEVEMDGMDRIRQLSGM